MQDRWAKSIRALNDHLVGTAEKHLVEKSSISVAGGVVAAILNRPGTPFKGVAATSLKRLNADIGSSKKLTPVATRSMLDHDKGILAGIPEKLTKAVSTLANQGWFITPLMPMPAIWRWSKQFESDEPFVAESAISDYFIKNYEQECDLLYAGLPQRKRILEAAVQAHHAGQYALSVPVFLAQADGVCEERTKASPFRRLKGRAQPQTATWAEQQGRFLDAVLLSLRKIYPISFSKGERPPEFTGLNRHSVLHGEDVNYDTQLNSLKAFSLLAHITAFVKINPGTCESSSTDADPDTSQRTRI